MSFTVVNSLGEGLVIPEASCAAFQLAYELAHDATLVTGCVSVQPGNVMVISDYFTAEKFDWLVVSVTEFLPATMDFSNPALVGQALLICCCVFALLFGIRQGRTG